MCSTGAMERKTGLRTSATRWVRRRAPVRLLGRAEQVLHRLVADPDLARRARGSLVNCAQQDLGALSESVEGVGGQGRHAMPAEPAGGDEGIWFFHAGQYKPG